MGFVFPRDETGKPQVWWYCFTETGRSAWLFSLAKSLTLGEGSDKFRKKKLSLFLPWLLGILSWLFITRREVSDTGSCIQLSTLSKALGKQVLYQHAI